MNNPPLLAEKVLELLSDPVVRLALGRLFENVPLYDQRPTRSQLLDL